MSLSPKPATLFLPQCGSGKDEGLGARERSARGALAGRESAGAAVVSRWSPATRFCLRIASSTTGLCHWDCAVLVRPHPRELPHPSTGKLSPCSSQRRSMLS